MYGEVKGALTYICPADHPLRFDARLLAVAQKLCPMIEESFEAVKQEITQMAAKQVSEGVSWQPWVLQAHQYVQAEAPAG
jgi:hypothetical protein